MVIESLVKPDAASALLLVLDAPLLLLALAPPVGVEPPPLELLPQAANPRAREAPSATKAVFLLFIVPPCRAALPVLARRPIRLVHICCLASLGDASA
jgi:hypothetical protein